MRQRKREQREKRKIKQEEEADVVKEAIFFIQKNNLAVIRKIICTEKNFYC